MNAGFAQTPGKLGDVTKIHFHNNEPGVGGPHVLNIYKLPSQDDKDLVIRPSDGMLKGILDDDDQDFGNDGIKQAGESIALSPMLGELCKGGTYANVHGTVTNDGGATAADNGSLRGNLEPTDKGEKICHVLDTMGILDKQDPVINHRVMTRITS